MAGVPITPFARSNALGIQTDGSGPYERGFEEAVRVLLTSLAAAAQGAKLKKGNIQMTLDCALTAEENGTFAICRSDQPSHLTLHLTWTAGDDLDIAESARPEGLEVPLEDIDYQGIDLLQCVVERMGLNLCNDALARSLSHHRASRYVNRMRHDDSSWCMGQPDDFWHRPVNHIGMV